MSERNDVVLVDEHDNELRSEEKIKAHRDGALHRAFSVFVFRVVDSQLELLLQKRQADKYHCGGLWTNTCCSHPQSGQEIVSSAADRLCEEMGFTVELERVGSFIYRAEFENGLIEHELDHVLVGWGNELGNISFNQDEVDDVKWVSLGELSQWMFAEPGSFTPWFAQALSIAKQSECVKPLV